MNLSKNQKLGLFILGLSAIFGVMMFSFISDLNKDKKEDRVETSSMQIQDPETFKPEGSKLKAYQKTSDYFDSLEDEESIDESYLNDKNNSESSPTSYTKESSSVGSNINHRQITQDDMFNFLSEDSSNNKTSSSGKSSWSNSGHSPQQKAEEFRKDSYDRYNRSVDKVVTSTTTTQVEPESAALVPVDTPASTSKRTIGDSVNIRKTSTMSSLDGFDNNGFSTLGEQEETPINDEYPFECMFVRAEKLRNGSRVSVRLLEDMVVGGKLIPKNTHLMAMVQIGERLFLNITSIEMGSRIYRLDYEAYDSDGGLGIYCPDLSASTRSATRSKGSSVVRRILGSRLGGLASDALDVGIQVAQNKAGEVTVSVPSGYKFFIVNKKQN